MKKCGFFGHRVTNPFLSFQRKFDKQGGVELFGSPVCGTTDFIKSFVATQVGRILELELQSHLGDLEGPGHSLKGGLHVSPRESDRCK